MNKIILDSPTICKNRIDYSYKIVGECSQAFMQEEKFFIEYNMDVSNVPEGILQIPLLANILPVAWVYDAEIILPKCDKKFYDCIPLVKKGYEKMYPMIELKGKLTAEILEENAWENESSLSFFSGGVDAFNTLISHAEEKPLLVTLWGADIRLEDEKGWENVSNHLKTVSKTFGCECATVKTSFRKVINEDLLSEKVEKSGDGWWHGFQHGIAIICSAAPIAYIKKAYNVYFASSFTKNDKGKYTCASDPTIDNFIKFGSTNVVHDGYEYDRQMKIRNITEFSKKKNTEISLRVCWESSGGSNCCKCEKCFRTILAIIAEKDEPKNFGFDYTNDQFKNLSKKIRYSSNKVFTMPRYLPIQDKIKINYKYKEVPKNLKWFYKCDLSKAGEHPYMNFYRNARRNLGRALQILKKGR